MQTDVTRSEAVDQKITDQLKFEEVEQPEQEEYFILDNIVFTEEAIDGIPLGLYYLILWKGKMHEEDIWEPVEGIAHLP